MQVCMHCGSGQISRLTREQKVPIIGEHFVREIPASDNVRPVPYFKSKRRPGRTERRSSPEWQGYCAAQKAIFLFLDTIISTSTEGYLSCTEKGHVYQRSRLLLEVAKISEEVLEIS